MMRTGPGVSFSRADTSLAGATRALNAPQFSKKLREKALARVEEQFTAETKRVKRLQRVVINAQRRIAFTVLENCSAVLIQALVRSHQSRRQLAKHRAASTIDRAWRAHTSRIRLRWSIQFIQDFCYERSILKIRARIQRRLNRAARLLSRFLRDSRVRLQYLRAREVRLLKKTASLYLKSVFDGAMNRAGQVLAPPTIKTSTPTLGRKKVFSPENGQRRLSPGRVTPPGSPDDSVGRTPRQTVRVAGRPSLVSPSTSTAPSSPSSSAKAAPTAAATAPPATTAPAAIASAMSGGVATSKGRRLVAPSASSSLHQEKDATFITSGGLVCPPSPHTKPSKATKR